MLGINKIIKRGSLCLVALIVFLCFAHEASAAKITLVNKTSVKVSVALQWWTDGSESRGGTKGWYGVEPGKSRTIVWSGIDGAAVQVGYMGFYAKGKGLVWNGDSSELYGSGWIHPKKAFKTETPDQAIPGGQKVNFRWFDIDFTDGGATAVGRIVLRP
ncbi:hypothetical protein Dpep_1352 [Dethiosulfovibrio peptidovorans DSM 11002]|uniref:Uncharacterized protein n=1 Tax=Dethiosulfovibrio peptidovorans DSM 11002 TaxID=469381 RepID=D2Z7D1_9BACT|nr:DUF1036 domain-containing protein [Dethiosulfovibrio peptidovorans]EFC91378.1 hypothetical protein Dpep_1352 [Dethiosulfovibrio peptidovorans DSM 11002]